MAAVTIFRRIGFVESLFLLTRLSLLISILEILIFRDFWSYDSTNHHDLLELP